MAFYLKYRPQSISDIDNAKIREFLPSLFSKSEIPHAFLFTGPRGIGKTSTARIIAKLINCTGRQSGKNRPFDSAQGKSIEPCNKCDVCLAITGGGHLDILEMDAASNRGIDEIRTLREGIGLMPTELKYKVYIIDEVHMLTTEAFNALLKTLEEPPKHAVFILCTTERHKVPETIQSRCMVISFAQASEVELERSIDRVVKGEKLHIDAAARRLIAASSGGSFREAAKLLEQLALENTTISEVAVKNILSLGLIDEEQLFSFIMKGDSRSATLIVEEGVNKGADPSVLIKALLSRLHRELMSHVVGTGTKGVGFDSISRAVRIFVRASADMRFSSLPQLPLEIAIVEYCEGEK